MTVARDDPTHPFRLGRRAEPPPLGKRHHGQGVSMNIRKLAVLAALLGAAVFVSTPVLAQNMAPSYTWTSSPIVMRNTNQPTGSVAAVTDWTTITRSGSTSIGYTPFADSITYTRGSSAGTYVADTSTAFVPSSWPRPISYTVAAGDTIASKFMTVYVHLVPSSITTVFDSVYVGFQGSMDGITWFNLNGTPTRVFVTDGAPANGNLTALVGVERNASENGGFVPTRCRVFPGATATIVPNLDLCEFPGYVRIITIADCAGTFQIEVAHWQ